VSRTTLIEYGVRGNVCENSARKSSPSMEPSGLIVHEAADSVIGNAGAAMNFTEDAVLEDDGVNRTDPLWIVQATP
jgi:hypothetical protein